MSEEPKNTTNNNIENPIISISATTEYVGEPISEEPSSKKEKNETGEIRECNHPIIINMPEEKEKGIILTHFWALLGLLINGILAWFTYLLFTKTIQANDTSMKALSEAKRANDISEANLKLAQESSKANDSITKINMELTQRSTDAQIKSFKEAQKGFEFTRIATMKDIRAKISVSNINVSNFEVNSTPEISITFQNMSKTTAHQFRRYTAFAFGTSEKDPQVVKWINNSLKEIKNATKIDFAPQTEISYPLKTIALDSNSFILLENSIIKLYIIVVCSFYDDFGKIHYVHSFSYYNYNQKRTFYCESFNDSN